MPASCAGGSAIDNLTLMADAFMRVYFTKSVGVMNMTLQGCLGLWMAWQITRLAIGRPIDIDQAKEQLFYFIISLALLSVPDRIWELFSITTSLSFWAAKNAYLIAAPATVESPSTLGDIACRASGMLSAGRNGGAFQALKELHPFSGFLNIILVVIATIPLFAIWWKGLRNIWAPQLRVFAVGILVPFIMAFSCFPPTRSTILTAIRLLLTSMTQVALVGAVIGLITAMFGQIFNSSQLAATFVTAETSVWLGSDDYWTVVVALLLAWLSFEEVLAIATTMFNTVVAQTRGLLGGLM
jgi:hypothetical protein